MKNNSDLIKKNRAEFLFLMILASLCYVNHICAMKTHRLLFPLVEWEKGVFIFTKKWYNYKKKLIAKIDSQLIFT